MPANEINVTKRGSQTDSFHSRKKGMSWPLAAFFLFTQIAGAGFLLLPSALANTGERFNWFQGSAWFEDVFKMECMAIQRLNNCG